MKDRAPKSEKSVGKTSIRDLPSEKSSAPKKGKTKVVDEEPVNSRPFSRKNYLALEKGEEKDGDGEPGITSDLKMKPPPSSSLKNFKKPGKPSTTDPHMFREKSSAPKKGKTKVVDEEAVNSRPFSRKNYLALEKGEEKDGDGEPGITSDLKMKPPPSSSLKNFKKPGKPSTTDPHMFREKSSAPKKGKTKVVDEEAVNSRPFSRKNYLALEKGEEKDGDGEPGITSDLKMKPPPSSSLKNFKKPGKPSTTDPHMFREKSLAPKKGKTKVVDEEPVNSRPFSRKNYLALEKGEEKDGDGEPGITSDLKMKPPPSSSLKNFKKPGKPSTTDPHMFREKSSAPKKGKTKVVDEEAVNSRPFSRKNYLALEKGEEKDGDGEPGITSDLKMKPPPSSSLKNFKKPGKPSTTDPHMFREKSSAPKKGKTKVVDEEAVNSRPFSRKNYLALEKGEEKDGDGEPGITSDLKMKPPPSSSLKNFKKPGKPSTTDPHMFREKSSAPKKGKTKVVDEEAVNSRPFSRKNYLALEKGEEKDGDGEPGITSDLKMKPPPSSSLKNFKKPGKPSTTDPHMFRKKYPALEKGEEKDGDGEPGITSDLKMKPPPSSSLKNFKKPGKPSTTDPHMFRGECSNLHLVETDADPEREVKPTFVWPPGIRKVLYPHQIEGVEWLFSLHHKGEGGGILCDDMGLGKTRQICSFVAGLFISNSIKKVIIVSPTTTMDQWMKELSVVGLSELMKMYTASCKNIRESNLQYVMQDKGIIVTTYDLISKNKNSFCNDCTWDYMFLDEGHLMKNPDTARVQNIKDITCRHRIIITGTPIQNNLKEFKTVLEFCLPEVFGEDNKLFEDIEIMRGSLIGDEKKRASKALRELKSIIKPYILRRGKEVLPRKLPDKDEIIVWIPLSDRQEKYYKTVIQSEAKSFKKIAALRNICNHTWLYDELKADDMNKSCKMPFIKSLIAESTRHEHKVVLFSSSVEMLDIIEDLLAPLDLRLKRIDGNTSGLKRTKQIKAFQEGDGDVFLLTSGAGGVGITLTAADRVIIVDPGWNPSVDNQSADRVHRIGQEKAVIVHRLITCKTIEEDIYKKQIFKDELSRSITEEDSKEITFTKKEEKATLTLSNDGYQESPTQKELFNEQDLQRRSENLKSHVRFLHTLGIYGVSFHDTVNS